MPLPLVVYVELMDLYQDQTERNIGNKAWVLFTIMKIRTSAPSRRYQSKTVQQFGTIKPYKGKIE